jgi:hypothetical protein
MMPMAARKARHTVSRGRRVDSSSARAACRSQRSCGVAERIRRRHVAVSHLRKYCDSRVMAGAARQRRGGGRPSGGT